MRTKNLISAAKFKEYRNFSNCFFEFSLYFVGWRNYPGLFTWQDCCSGEEAAHEAVFVYREWSATKPMCW